MCKCAEEPEEFGIGNRPDIDIRIVSRCLQIGIGVGHIISIGIKKLEKDELNRKGNKAGNAPDPIGLICP